MTPPGAWTPDEPPPRVTFNEDEAAARRALVGTVVDQYEIVELLGYGAMGCVYRVRHPILGRDYALKTLSADRTASEVAAKRFLREAHAAAQVEHPNVVRVVYSGMMPTGEAFLVMELLRGRSLSTEISEGLLSPERTAWIARQLALGLEEIHRRGFVHRDLKPSNVMLVQTDDGKEIVKILDLGLVGMIEPEAPELKLTQQGHLMGTPLYMAPEAFTSGAISAATDLYSLGTVMYEMLSGAPPFNGSIKEILWHHCFTVPPALPPKKGLDVLVSQLMAKDASDRPQSAGAVVEEIDRRLKRGALRRFLEDAPARAWNMLAAKTHGHQRWVIAAGTATVTALLAFGFGNALRGPATQPMVIDEPPKVVASAGVGPSAGAGAGAGPSAGAGAETSSGAGEGVRAGGGAAAGAGASAGAEVTGPDPSPAPGALIAASPSSTEAPDTQTTTTRVAPAPRGPREVLITSDPPGARVESSSGLLGMTPISVMVDRRRATTFTVRLGGFEDRRVTIGPRDQARKHHVRFKDR